jgi:predicted TIM-barrel fold metal-dependent hydrolase
MVTLCILDGFGLKNETEGNSIKLAGTPNLYVDLSSSLYELSPQDAKKFIYKYGVDKVLWGTDYPMWEAENEMELFHKIGLTPEEENMILYENSAKILGLK